MVKQFITCAFVCYCGIKDWEPIRLCFYTNRCRINIIAVYNQEMIQHSLFFSTGCILWKLGWCCLFWKRFYFLMTNVSCYFLIVGSLTHDHFIIPTPLFLPKSSVVKWRSWHRHGKMVMYDGILYHRRSYFVKGCSPWWHHKLQWHVYIADYWPSAYSTIDNTTPKLTYKLLTIYAVLDSKQGIQQFS